MCQWAEAIKTSGQLAATKIEDECYRCDPPISRAYLARTANIAEATLKRVLVEVQPVRPCTALKVVNALNKICGKKYKPEKFFKFWEDD